MLFFDFRKYYKKCLQKCLSITPISFRNTLFFDFGIQMKCIRLILMLLLHILEVFADFVMFLFEKCYVILKRFVSHAALLSVLFFENYSHFYIKRTFFDLGFDFLPFYRTQWRAVVENEKNGLSKNHTPFATVRKMYR